MGLGDGRRRLRAALLALAFVTSLFLGRLVQLQGLDAPAYAAAAEQNRRGTVTLPATRGAILDVHGVALATTVEARNVTADQRLIAESTTTDARTIARQLAPLVGIDADALTARLTGTRRFAYVAKDVTPQTWRKITELRPRPVGIFSEKVGKRVYPGRGLAGNVVGFVGADGQGLGGVEYALQGLLAGRDGRATYERSPDGRQIPVGTSASTDPVPGRDVVLTIDRDIQWVAQDAVARKVEEVGAESGTVVVLDPRTGRVLALAAAPTVDPNRPGRTPPADRGNRPLEEAFEPGSTGKLFTASALLEEGAVTPSTPITVPPRLRRGGKTFKDWEEHGTLHLTYAGTVARSSNMGTILATERMGFDKLYPYLRKFGLGEPLDLGLPENGGSLPHPDTWSATTPYTLAFGQGYSVNALQMASAVGAIAADGVRIHPRLVGAYVDGDGTRRPPPAPDRTRVVSARTARTVRLLMEGVVGEGGTAPKTAIPGYRVGGKTGTAQRYDAGCGCYRGYTMSYIGIAPADDPALVVAVTLQKPQSGSGGGSTAGPVFKEVMSFALQSQRIPPTGAAPPEIRLTTD